jgi:hypothetical protein
VGRPTKWGNPFRVGKEMTGWQKAFIAIHITEAVVEKVRELYKSGEMRKPLTLTQSLEYYLIHIRFQIKSGNLNLDELRKYDYLSCFCPLSQRCHTDILIELLNDNN